jgi:membrane fusion protein, multidrug efflux system
MRWSSIPKLLVIPMIIALSACSEEKEAAPPIRPVLSSIIELSNLPTPSFAGTVAPKTETPLGFRVGGLMVARDVNTGDVVTKGELLASLEPTSLELAVRSAQAQLANAQAQLANARSTEERARATFQGGTATKSSLESSVQATQTAQSAVVQAQTALDKANEDLSYAQLLATFDGVVTATSIEVGQVVSAGQSVLTVAMPGERDAVIDIPEGELIPVIGDAYSILLQINPAITSAGVVREVAPAADAATRTRRVKIALKNPPDAFRIGTTITAIRQARDVKKLFLPASAILSQDGKALVWIVDEKAETVRSQEVRLRDKTSAHPEVVSGLEPGARVVIAGVHSLKEGQKIKVEGGARS